MNIVEVRDVSKWYGEVVGLNRYSAVIGEGITGLIGPNGAGKSTLIKMLVGLTTPDKGEIRVFGKDPFDNPEIMALVGYCPDSERTYDELDSLTFLSYMARMHGMKKEDARTRALECLDIVGMEALERPIKTYSKGMRQRVKIAQALLHSPKLLILDEPFSGVDPLVRSQLFDILESLSRSGIHIIISSHILFEIERLAKNVVLMARGKHIVSGQVETILDTIENHTHSLLITTDNPPILGSELLKSGIASVAEIRDRHTLFVKTQHSNEFYVALPKIAIGNGMRIEGLVPVGNDLYTVFEKVVGK